MNKGLKPLFEQEMNGIAAYFYPIFTTTVR